MAEKLPALQFYPGDWRKDPGIQALDFHHRGVWFELLMLMHESEDRGRLMLNGRPMPDAAIARYLGISEAEWKQIRSTLLDYGVASEDQNGALFNRRMVRDESLRRKKIEAGRKGGKRSRPGRTRKHDASTAASGNEAELKQKGGSSSSVSSSSSPSVLRDASQPTKDALPSKVDPTLSGSVSIETGAAGAAPHVENSPSAGEPDAPPSRNGADAHTPPAPSPPARRPPKRGHGPEPVGAAVAGALSLVQPKQDTERDILSRLMGEVRTWAYRDRRAPYGYDDGRDYVILRQWLRHGRTEAEITQAIRGARRLPGIGHVEPFTLRLLQDPDVWRHATELGSGTLDAAIPAEVKARIAEIMDLIRKAA